MVDAAVGKADSGIPRGAVVTAIDGKPIPEPKFETEDPEALRCFPGTTRPEHLRDDLGAAAVRLDAAAMGKLETLINQRNVAGPRYAPQATGEVDTENF